MGSGCILLGTETTTLPRKRMTSGGHQSIGSCFRTYEVHARQIPGRANLCFRRIPPSLPSALRRANHGHDNSSSNIVTILVLILNTNINNNNNNNNSHGASHWGRSHRSLPR